MLNKIKALERLIQLRTPGLTEDISLYLNVADEFEKTDHKELIKRADFIRRQCSGDKAEKLFNNNRKSWGIPNFSEDLVTVDDFKRGFLYKFRDHTTSWSDNQKAKKWFLNSFEAKLVQVYEFWSCDNGKEEIIETRTGDYKSILKSLLAQGDYEVLTSPTFRKQELDDFVRTHLPMDGDFTVDEIISEYINVNPNY
jgi:CRISPR/Cas system-associated protein Cas5 (RAMP superfamily)